jgi:modulator of FtsH protease
MDMDTYAASRVTHSEDVKKLLKNTYMLLSATVAFSALMAYVSIAIGGTGMGWGGFIAIFALLFGIKFTQESWIGLPMVFAFTGTFGYFCGPLIAYHLDMPGGPNMVLQALVGTATIFFGMSGYALVSKKDFSFMGAFLWTGLWVCIGAMILSFFVAIPGLQLAISTAVILIMSGLILFDTSLIVNGGETNYISATTSLYLDLLNIFIHLLSILGIFGDD